MAGLSRQPPSGGRRTFPQNLCLPEGGARIIEASRIDVPRARRGGGRDFPPPLSSFPPFSLVIPAKAGIQLVIPASLVTPAKERHPRERTSPPRKRGRGRGRESRHTREMDSRLRGSDGEKNWTFPHPSCHSRLSLSSFPPFSLVIPALLSRHSRESGNPARHPRLSRHSRERTSPPRRRGRESSHIREMDSRLRGSDGEKNWTFPRPSCHSRPSLSSFPPFSLVIPAFLSRHSRESTSPPRKRGRESPSTRLPTPPLQAGRIRHYDRLWK